MLTKRYFLVVLIIGILTATSGCVQEKQSPATTPITEPTLTPSPTPAATPVKTPAQENTPQQIPSSNTETSQIPESKNSGIEKENNGNLNPLHKS